MAKFYRIREVEDPQTREMIREVATEVFAYFAAFLKDTYDIVIERGVLRVAEVVTDKIRAKELCLEEVCVTKEELKALLEKNQIQNVTEAEIIKVESSISATASGSVEVTPTLTTEPSITPEASPAPSESPSQTLETTFDTSTEAISVPEATPSENPAP